MIGVSLNRRLIPSQSAAMAVAGIGSVSAGLNAWVSVQDRQDGGSGTVVFSGNAVPASRSDKMAENRHFLSLPSIEGAWCVEKKILLFLKFR
ncbi:hypothetical protein [Gluconacetobacter sacchari]|uniref:Uncharacterized protein n=1 Tax=Gluconacetobacter sacchari TaxID=92759 RepID=A0A7W4IA28_9PROT|nr:hypothetical protein [Gluconacetobacter sacchari]MBB2158977.1 hypothetical protein [Gluconacetobacter sacchari]